MADDKTVSLFVMLLIVISQSTVSNCCAKHCLIHSFARQLPIPKILFMHGGHCAIKTYKLNELIQSGFAVSCKLCVG